MKITREWLEHRAACKDTVELFNALCGDSMERDELLHRIGHLTDEEFQMWVAMSPDIRSYTKSDAFRCHIVCEWWTWLVARTIVAQPLPADIEWPFSNRGIEVYDADVEPITQLPPVSWIHFTYCRIAYGVKWPETLKLVIVDCCQFGPGTFPARVRVHR